MADPVEFYINGKRNSDGSIGYSCRDSRIGEEVVRQLQALPLQASYARVRARPELRSAVDIIIRGGEDFEVDAWPRWCELRRGRIGDVSLSLKQRLDTEYGSFEPQEDSLLFTPKGINAKVRLYFKP